jgi:hypothetical protein
MKLDADKPEIHYRGGKVLDNFDAIIPRIRPSITFYGCALTRQFEAMKVFCLNSAMAIHNPEINCIPYSYCYTMVLIYPQQVLLIHH